MARQTDKQAAPSEETTPANRFNTSAGTNRNWLYGLAGLIILILVFLAGAGIAHRHQSFRSAKVFGGGYGMRAGARRGFMQGGFGGGATSGEARITGVVTAVNGTSFTLAGNGAATDVSTSSSTRYQNGDQVKVNDSVIVFGTYSNGTVSAAQVVINP